MEWALRVGVACRSSGGRPGPESQGCPSLWPSLSLYDVQITHEICPSADGGWTRQGVPIRWNITWSQTRNKVLICATTWRSLGNMILSERSWMQKDSECHPFIWNFRKGKLIETENRSGVSRGYGDWGDNGVIPKEFLLSWWKWSKIDYHDGCTDVCIY